MIHLNKTIDGLISNGTVEHIAVRVGKRDEVICDVFRGGVCETTLFDMASVTKNHGNDVAGVDRARQRHASTWRYG